MADSPVATDKPTLPTGQEIYDGIMSQIEPDLVTDQLPLLDQKYPNENPEDKAKRMERYKVAFAEYDKKYREYVDQLHQWLHNFKKTSVAHIETERRAEESVQMAALESTILTQ